MLNRFLAGKAEEARGPKQKRPYLATECHDLNEADRWRQQILREIGRKVMEIQNAGLGDHRYHSNSSLVAAACLKQCQTAFTLFLDEKMHKDVHFAEQILPFGTGCAMLVSNAEYVISMMKSTSLSGRKATGSDELWSLAGPTMPEARLSSQMMRAIRYREPLAKEVVTSILGQQSSYLACGNFLRRKLPDRYGGHDIRCTDTLMQITMGSGMMRMECLRKLRAQLKSGCVLRYVACVSSV